MICEHCSDEIDEESSYPGEGEDNLCQSCYRDMCQTCQICEESELPSRMSSELILVKEELAETASADLPSGIYRVKSRPYLLCSVFDTSLIACSVELVAPLPKPDDAYEISGHICKVCALPFHLPTPDLGHEAETDTPTPTEKDTP